MALKENLKPKTDEEEIVRLWQCGLNERQIAREIGWSWNSAEVALLIRQLRLLGVSLRPNQPPPGEHELELEALRKRVDLERIKLLAAQGRT